MRLYLVAKLCYHFVYLDIKLQNSTFQIVDLEPSEAERLIDRVWISYMTRGDEDRHWRWQDFVEDVQNDYFSEVKYLRATESYNVEAAVWYETNAKSVLEEGFGALHIARLAVAPWNRPDRSDRRYKGLGKLLVQYVSWRSLKLGFKGRIILEALPGAEEFYLHLGFKEIGVGEDGLKSYELPKDKARELLKEFNV